MWNCLLTKLAKYLLYRRKSFWLQWYFCENGQFEINNLKSLNKIHLNSVESALTNSFMACALIQICIQYIYLYMYMCVAVWCAEIWTHNLKVSNPTTSPLSFRCNSTDTSASKSLPILQYIPSVTLHSLHWLPLSTRIEYKFSPPHTPVDQRTPTQPF